MGGTSAGASIWSDVMMVSSTTVNGIMTPTIGYGLRLWPEAIIDQHFTQRQRLQRLEIAVSKHPTLYGIGIDESTGILYTNKTSFRVVGPGTVTVLRPVSGGHEKIILRGGDVYNMKTDEITLGERSPFVEEFEDAGLPLDYADGSFTNAISGITWSFVHSKEQGVYLIQGRGFMLRRPSGGSYLEATFPNGVGTFTFKYRKAHTGEFTRQFVVLVNGEQKFISDPFGTGTGNEVDEEGGVIIRTFSETINERGPVTIRITYPNVVPDGAASNPRQITIDNIEWTEYK
jgi:hypothetical protein